MQMRGAPLLERRRVFHSRDLDETAAFLGGIGFGFEAEGDVRRTLDVRLNGVYFPNAYFGYAQYGAGATIRTTPARTDHWIQFPLRGGVEASDGRRTIACGRRTAVIVAPRRGHRVRVDDGSARMQLSLTGPAVQRQLAALLGDEPPREPLEFAPEIDLGAGYGRSLARYLALALAEFEEDGSALANPLAMAEFEQMTLTTLLLLHRHNHSSLLGRARARPAPRDVKRALDYMHANLAAPITLADLVAASGVPGRTLLQHFRDFQGASPMRYLRLARLRAVREAFRTADIDENVATIAERFGFAHLGRFAMAYRSIFGEGPRETLAQGRGAPRRRDGERAHGRANFANAPSPAYRLPSMVKPGYGRFD